MYRFLPALLILLLISSHAWGMSEWQGNNASLNVRGFGRLSGSYLHYSDNPQVQEKDDTTWAGVFRLLGDGSIGQQFDVEMNLLQEVVSLIPNTTGIVRRDVERSDLFTWQQTKKNDYLAQMSLDTLVLNWRSSRLDFSLGRQPVNLATTFFIAPNDFFAPFAAQTFFRTYKSGVDAARAEFRIGALTQLSLIGVLSYEEENQSDTGWSKDPAWRRSSMLARFVTNLWDWEWTFLGGTVNDETIAGISLQGELFQWLGVRTEGHYASPEEGEGDDVAAFCLGLEHRFESSLNIQLEYFHHGKGYASINDANIALLTGEAAEGYLGRNYTALSAGYEFSPLAMGQALLLINWTDNSRLWSVHLVYSISNESDLAVTISLPEGNSPDLNGINSEFGSLPCSANLEYRIYF